jgi:hypothetical protein
VGVTSAFTTFTFGLPYTLVFALGAHALTAASAATTSTTQAVMSSFLLFMTSLSLA